MADKSKTIKESTDKELDDLLRRLEKERQIQYIIMDLIRNSKPKSPVDPYAPYTPEVSITVSTEAAIESMYHVGVPGMHWGVRKARGGSSGGKYPKPLSPSSGDSKMARKNLKKPVRALSDQELKHLTKRLQMEKQYKDLKPNDVKKGMAVVKALIAIGTTIITLHNMSQTVPGQAFVKKVGIKKLVKATT